MLRAKKILSSALPHSSHLHHHAMSFFLTEFAVKKRSGRNTVFCGLRRAQQPLAASTPKELPLR